MKYVALIAVLAIGCTPEPQHNSIYESLLTGDRYQVGWVFTGNIYDVLNPEMSSVVRNNSSSIDSGCYLKLEEKRWIIWSAKIMAGETGGVLVQCLTKEQIERGFKKING